MRLLILMAVTCTSIYGQAQIQDESALLASFAVAREQQNAKSEHAIQQTLALKQKSVTELNRAEQMDLLHILMDFETELWLSDNGRLWEATFARVAEQSYRSLRLVELSIATLKERLETRAVSAADFYIIEESLSSALYIFRNEPGANEAREALSVVSRRAPCHLAGLENLCGLNKVLRPESF
jgi:hypothetical protein